MEKAIEKRLVTEVEKRGGTAFKFISPGKRGVPDRLVVFAEGVSAFIELKDKGKKPDPLQLKRIQELRDLGCQVFVIDRKEQIKEVLDEIQSAPIPESHNRVHHKPPLMRDTGGYGTWKKRVDTDCAE
jgi:hypothetical protein